MIRFVFYLIVLLAVVGGVGWGIAQGTGYVLITFDQYRYESTLWVFLGLLVGLWLAVVIVRRVLRLLAVSGAVVNPWSRRNRERRVQKASLFGQRELAEGQWPQALEHLTLAADNDSRPLVYFLGAARAANEMNQHEQCDRLLNRALTREPEAALAIGLTRGQLLVERGDLVAARDLLADLHREFPRQTQVMSLLQRLYVQLADWAPLCKLLPELRRQKVLSDVKLDELEHQAWQGVLLGAAQLDAEDAEASAAFDRLVQLWNEMPSRLQTEAPLVAAYATALHALGMVDQAVDILSAAIPRQFDAALIDLYGTIHSTDSMQQLLRAEGWAAQNHGHAALLLAMGRLAVCNELWEKARTYLDDSLALSRRAETCAELAKVLATLGDKERSNQLFTESLSLLDHKLLALR